MSLADWEMEIRFPSPLCKVLPSPPSYLSLIDAHSHCTDENTEVKFWKVKARGLGHPGIKAEDLGR